MGRCELLLLPPPPLPDGDAATVGDLNETRRSLPASSSPGKDDMVEIGARRAAMPAEGAADDNSLAAGAGATARPAPAPGRVESGGPAPSLAREEEPGTADPDDATPAASSRPPADVASGARRLGGCVEAGVAAAVELAGEAAGLGASVMLASGGGESDRRLTGATTGSAKCLLVGPGRGWVRSSKVERAEGARGGWREGRRGAGVAWAGKLGRFPAGCCLVGLSSAGKPRAVGLLGRVVWVGRA